MQSIGASAAACDGREKQAVFPPPSPSSTCRLTNPTSTGRLSIISTSWAMSDALFVTVIVYVRNCPVCPVPLDTTLAIATSVVVVPGPAGWTGPQLTSKLPAQLPLPGVPRPRATEAS